MTIDPSKIFVFDKPSGVSTHSPDANLGARASEGILEYVARVGSLAQPPLAVHRLDKETSGVLLAAVDAPTADSLAKLFAEHKISKRYLFITNRVLAKQTHDWLEVHSEISKLASGTYASVLTRPNDESGVSQIDDRAQEDDPARIPNSKTRLRYVRSCSQMKFHLWEAEPASGKPHQIRLHAENLGIPILGDEIHGGSYFPRVCLHAKQISVPLTEAANVTESAAFRAESTEPDFFQDLDLCHDQLLVMWLSAVDRRMRWSKLSGIDLRPESNQTCRLIHSDGGPLRADKLADVLSLQWFDEQEPSPHEQESIDKLVEILRYTKVRFQLRLDRGRDPQLQPEWRFPEDLDVRWIAWERDFQFEMRLDSGLSTGLFLDQRANRGWVRENSRSRSVLNLFAYTGGLSISAAVGGALDVTTVDISKTCLEWSRRNFQLNGFDLSADQRFHFKKMDALDYLEWAQKKQLQFDLIICDPPSFGRSERGVFKLEKDLPSLMGLMWSVLKPGGEILFSCNLEIWDLERMYEKVTKALSQASKVTAAKSSTQKPMFKLHPGPSQDWDFELPREDSILKSVLISKSAQLP